MATTSALSPSAARQQALSLSARGRELFAAARFGEAAGVLTQLADLWRSLGECEDELSTRFLLATTHLHLEQLDNAARELQEALTLAWSLGVADSAEAIEKPLMFVGTRYLNAGQLESALRQFEAVQASAHRRGDASVEHTALLAIGPTLMQLDRLGEAGERLRESLALVPHLAANRPAAELLSRMPLAMCAAGQGHLRQAVQHLERALTLASMLDDTRAEATIHMELGNVLHRLGDSERSVSEHRLAEAFFRRSGDRQELAQVLYEMSRAYFAGGDPESAQACCDEALDLARTIGDKLVEGRILAQLGHLALLHDDRLAARQQFAASLALKQQTRDLTGTAATLASLSGISLTLGSTGEALQQATRALEMAKTLKRPEDCAMAAIALGVARFRNGDLAGAEASLREGLDGAEALRAGLEEDRWQISLADRYYMASRFLQQVLVERHEPGQALEVAEGGRAQALIRLVSKRLRPADRTALEPLGRPPLAALQRLARETASTLVELGSRMIQGDGPVASDPDEQIKHLEMYVWVVQPTGEVQVRLSPPFGEMISSGGTAAHGEPLWRQLRNLAQPAGRLLEASSRRWPYRWLIEPIESLLPTGRDAHLVLIPQDAFFLLPWACFEDRTGMPLIERFAFSVSPSIQLLDACRRRRLQIENGTGEALVVGDPEFAAGSGLERLPCAAQEALAVAALLGTRPLLGSAATKAEVLQRLPRARILHFATHALVQPTESLDISGAIAFAPGHPGDSGLLTAGEIMNLELAAELAVLSACRTAEGRPSTDSVIGLARAFLAAGVPSVVVSLWPVNDDSTAFLMERFYDSLHRGERKVHALRQAMLATRKIYPSPVDWAGFLLLGDAS